MRMSAAFVPTLKESPADAQVRSHVYMVRGGFIRQLAAGVYNFLPLGWRVIHKIEAIIRDEMTRAGAQEVLMPAAVPAELWKESGRWDKYGPELLRFKDRKGADFCFGPTHEEVIVDMVRRDTSSYRDLPLNLFQIQAKFRDELRPRAGLMRGREFIMKDAYSFDVDREGALRSYEAMYAAYERIFRRCGLAFRVVEADTGAIGGDRSHEFQVLAPSGEDTLVACDACDYAANVEQAEFRPAAAAPAGEPAPLARVATPNARTIDEVAAFLGVDPARIVKTLVYVAGDELVAVLVRGDHAVNEVKLKKVLGVDAVHLAGDKQTAEATGAPVGFAGPVGLDLRVIADADLRGATGMVCGANEADAHYTGVDLERDARVDVWAPIRLAQEGDRCPRCDAGSFRVERGIEVGHVFYLGTVYSEPMNCTFLDEQGQTRVMEMGCYGIGVTRVAAAAIEQHSDDRGIIWPMSIAPYEVQVLSLQAKDDAVVRAADDIYDALRARGIEVLYDDRPERAGAKFADADLIGVPLRVQVGKRGLAAGTVEVKWRRDAGASDVPVADVVDRIAALVAEEKARLSA
ncbi:MAG: proline--tRNA ligase [Deltaproteobacteria bacterium]|nr:MAG: proline--tRNA ligase [Deltaproteobacteria bacterium]